MLTQPTTLVYTIREAASLLTLGRSSMYQAVRNGSIPSVKLGRRLLIPRAALERLLENSLKTGSDDK